MKDIANSRQESIAKGRAETTETINKAIKDMDKQQLQVMKEWLKDLFTK